MEVDWLRMLGVEALHVFWLPLLAWTLFTLVALGLLRLSRTTPAQVHYAARIGLLLALPLGLVLALFTDLSFLSLFSRETADVPAEAALFMPPASAALPMPTSADAWPLYHVLGLLTVLGSLVAAIRLCLFVYHARALARFRTQLLAAPAAATQPFVQTLATALGIRRPIRVVVTTQDMVPMALGWWRPVIVLPKVLLEEADHLRMVLLHELIHIRHLDALVQRIEQLIGAFFYIHPLVAWLQGSLAHYRELACDAEVLTQPRVSRKRYAALLYRFAVPERTRRPLALSMAVSDNQLTRRISAMKSQQPSSHYRFSPKRLGLTLAALLFGSATLFVACSDLTTPDAPAGVEATQRAVGEPEIFMVVEEMPELVGGLPALQEQMKYPRIARLAGIEGRVIIQFVVDEQGRVVDPSVVKGLGAGCDEEALRVLQQATFRPGRQGGQAVSVKMSIPFTFLLDSDTPPRR